MVYSKLLLPDCLIQELKKLTDELEKQRQARYVWPFPRDKVRLTAIGTQRIGIRFMMPEFSISCGC